MSQVRPSSIGSASEKRLSRDSSVLVSVSLCCMEASPDHLQCSRAQICDFECEAGC